MRIRNISWHKGIAVVQGLLSVCVILTGVLALVQGSGYTAVLFLALGCGTFVLSWFLWARKRWAKIASVACVLLFPLLMILEWALYREDDLFQFLGIAFMMLVIPLLFVEVWIIALVVEWPNPLFLAFAVGLGLFFTFLWRRRKVSWKIGAVAIGIVTVMILVRAFFFLGLSTNRDGLAKLNSLCNTSLSPREVYVVRGGFLPDLHQTYQFKFQATLSEIEEIREPKRLEEISYDGGPVHWPPGGVQVYWWDPPQSGSLRVFRSRGIPRVLLYDPDSEWAYYHWWDG